MLSHFLFFFLVYIYQKHKHNIILVPSSFSTISFVVIDQKRTIISYNKKKNNTTTSFAMGAKQRTTRSITTISKQQVKKKTTMNIIALIVITLGSQLQKKNPKCYCLSLLHGVLLFLQDHVVATSHHGKQNIDEHYFHNKMMMSSIVIFSCLQSNIRGQL